MFPLRSRFIILTAAAAVLAAAALGVTALILSRRQLDLRLAETRRNLQLSAADTAARIGEFLPFRLEAAGRDSSDPLVNQIFCADAEGHLLFPERSGEWAKHFRMIFLDPAPPADDPGYTLLPAPGAAGGSAAAKTAPPPGRDESLFAFNQMYSDSLPGDHAAARRTAGVFKSASETGEGTALSPPGRAGADSGSMPTRFQLAAAGRTEGKLPAVVGGQLTVFLWRRGSDGIIRGVELAGDRLLTEASSLLPALMPGERMTLCDAVGKVFSSSGEAISDPTQAASVALSPELLPGMRLEAEFDAARIGRSAAPPWEFMAAALLGAVLISGGTLLLLIRRELREVRLRNGFVSQVSHELKTPLTAIRMYVEMLVDHPELPAPRRQRYLETVGEECVRLNRMVENILDFNRLSEGRRHFSLRRLDPAAILREAEPHFSAIVARAGMKLTMEVPPESFELRFDRDALIGITANLLDNAAKYASSGGRVIVKLDPDRRELHCRDFGPGVPEGAREKIFERFFRADDALTAAAGFGLGLAIARETARGLGGELTCRGADPGADFVLKFPEEEHHEQNSDRRG